MATGRASTAGTVLAFFWQRKWWWLTPMVLVLLLLAVLIAFSQTSAIAPFVYSLF
jgi:hypothetical protein